MLYRSIFTAVLLTGLAATAHAQQAGGTAPAGTPTTPGGTPVAVDEPWMLFLGVNGSYEGNALFTGSTEGSTEFANQVVGTLTRSWKLRRGGASLGVSGNQIFYGETASLNDFRYSATGALSHMITRRLTWSGQGSITSGLARDSKVLSDAGLVLPSGTTRTSSSASVFTYLLTPKAQLSWGLAESGVGFDSAFFRGGGTNLSSTINLSRQVGKSQNIGIIQEYSRTFSDVQSSDVYGVLGSWSIMAGRGWMAFASGGVRPYSLPDNGGYQVSTALAVGVTKPVRPGQIVGVTYSKSIGQTFGLTPTNNLVDSISGNYSAALRRNLSASVSGIYTRGQNPVPPNETVTGEVFQGSLAYRVLQNLAVSIGTAVYSRVEEPSSRVTSTTTFLNVSYVTTWR